MLKQKSKIKKPKSKKISGAIKLEIPKEVNDVLKSLEKAGFEAYAVGGCVRDILIGKKPKDWDVTTNAKPEEIIKIFPKSFYANRFGTVTILTSSSEPTLREIEITTYRIDEKYTDKRHPDSIKFTTNLEEDLARRDFTINAIALKITNYELRITNYKIVDPFGGQKDLKDKLIRAVGEPQKRFEEDALRLMRAVRQATEFNFEIEKKTEHAIIEKAGLIDFISKERIRDELVKILNCRNAADGIEMMRKLKLLKHILPEVDFGYGVGQNKHHIYEVYEHNLRALDFAAKQNFSLEVRLASLLHDVAKPQTKQGKGPDSTFYGHEIEGAKMAYEILTRLKFPKRQIEKITKLIRYHLFYYNVGEVSESSVRRLLRKVGPENIKDLLEVRMADRIGSGVPKAKPYKLRHLEYLIEKVSRDPISVKTLKVNGNDVMKILAIEAGPKIGYILNTLLAEVLENPALNTKEYLEDEIKQLGKLPESDLKKIMESAVKKIEEVQTKVEQTSKEKYWVT